MTVKSIHNNTGAIEYIVYALEVASDKTTIYIHSDSDSPLPYEHDLVEYEITDASVPTEWVADGIEYISGKKVLRISYPEWVKDRDFYWSLSDGDKKQMEIHKSYRNKYQDGNDHQP